MHGNVWEWCRDVYASDVYRQRVDGIVDPWESASDSRATDRVVRGGSWYDSARRCRSAYRNWRGPSNRVRIRGFRVCLFPGPVPKEGESGANAQP